MANYIRLPNGAYYEAPEGLDYTNSIRKAYQDYPEAFGQPAAPKEDKTGFFPALGAGFRAGAGETAAGLGELTGIEALTKFGKEQREKAAQAYTPTTTEDIDAAKGVLPTAGKYLSKYITEPVGEAVGSIAGGFGLPIAASIGAAAAAPEFAVGALGAGALAFAATDAPIEIGKEIAYQKEKGQKPDYVAATASGLAMAAVNGLSEGLMTGPMRSILGKTARDTAKELAPKVLAGELTSAEAATQINGTLRNIAQGTAQNAAIGTGMMTADEALRRAGAGEDLTSPEAIKAYKEQAGTAIALSPFFGLAHGLGSKGAAERTLTEAGEARTKATADEIEAARSTPDALLALDSQYTALKQQMDNIQAAVPEKPKKKATTEDKQAYRDAKIAADQALEEFKTNNPDYQNVFAEYNKRKDSIDVIKAQQAPEAAPEVQPTQEVTPPAPPTPDVTKLMDQHDTLKLQEDQLAAQMAQSPEAYEQLRPQHKELTAQIGDLSKQIEELGGTTVKPAEFEAQAKVTLGALDKQIEAQKASFAKASDPNQRDYEVADKSLAKIKELNAEREKVAADIEARRKTLTEKQANLTQRGETRPLFTEEEAPIPKAQVEDVTPPKIPGMAEKPEEAVSAPVSAAPVATEVVKAEPSRAEKATEASAKAYELGEQLREAEASLAPMQKMPANSRDQSLYLSAVAKVTDLKKQLADLQNVKPERIDTKSLDLFGEENVIRTALRNGDQRTIDSIQAEKEKIKLGQLDEEKAKRDALVKALDERLDLSGKKVSRDVTPEEYDRVMADIETQKRLVETPQRNAKKSLLQEINDLADEHAQLTAQMERGIATPTMQDKAMALQAKLGKGEAPTERPMQGLERANLQRKINAVLNKYNKVLAQIDPVRERIENLYQSLHKVKVEEARPASVVAGEKRTIEDLRALSVRGKSKQAATAARINRGDVRKEAETSEKMRNLAAELGREDPRYIQLIKENQRRIKALTEKYGKGDSAVTKYINESFKSNQEKAIQYGKETPEYKATLKEQIAYFQETLGQGVQEVKNKRGVQETRKVNRAPSNERTGSPESRSATESKQEGAAQRLTKDQILATYRNQLKKDLEAARKFDEDSGTAYRTREQAGESVDAAEAQAFIDKVQANLPENVKFVYAADSGKIPVKLLKQIAADKIDPHEAMVQGAVFSDGTVLVVGDQHINLKDLEATVAHELVGHYGIDTIIGIDKLREYANKTDLRKLAQDIGGDKLLAEVQQVAASNAALGRDEATQKLQVLREIIAHTEEARVTEGFREKAGRWLKELVGMVRDGLKRMGFTEMSKMSTSDVFYALRESRKAFADRTIGPYRAADGEIAFRSKKEPVQFGKSILASEPTIKDKLLGNFMGLAGRVQLVDQHAALSEAFKQGMSKGQISSHEAQNAEFALRFGQKRSQYAGQFLTNGRVELVENPTKDGIEYIYKSKPGVNMTDVAKSFADAKVGNDSETEAMATLYLAGKRASSPSVGWEKLNFENPEKVKAEYNEMMAYLKSKPEAMAAFEKGAQQYKEYNAGLLDFLVQTGALSAKKAEELKATDYVPFYRVNKGGVVELMVDKETPIRISNIKDEPQLKELIGGNKHILPLFTSAVQNTFMLTNMGLRNQSIKESAFMLRKIGIASRLAPGMGPADASTVRFRVKGEEHHVVIDNDMYGIPADLIIKGMEGIKTTIPVAVKLMGMPTNILRQFITRNPTYALRQVIKDPMSAWLTVGTDATPVLSSMKELGKMIAGRSDVERKLMESGAISSNVFTGDQRDMAKFLKDISAGKSGWAKAMAKLDAIAMQGDAATRAVVYKDSLAKGMTEQQALLRTIESMNFERKGLSPSMQVLSTIIPFFNAQIQSMDVLYRAFKGDMPFSEQLKIRQKLWARGTMMAMGTMAYAAMMQDDEAYKRAKPEERYGNWFVYVPGVSEPLRVPIPYELGYLFKALPEAVIGAASGNTETNQAVRGMATLIGQSNPFSLPQAVKPLTEAVLGKTFFGGDIESMRERQTLTPAERYRDTTSEVAKTLGSITGNKAVKDLTGYEGVSPLMIDHLIRGYTGPLGLAVTQLANPLLAPSSKQMVEQPSMKPSQLPFFGGLFETAQGRGTLDEAYDRMHQIQQAKGTFDKMIQEGRRAEAQEFAQRYAGDMALATTSAAAMKRLGEITKYERMVRASPTMSQAEKDLRLQQIDKIKTTYAQSLLTASERTRHR
jgi:hypothetical protein